MEILKKKIKMFDFWTNSICFFMLSTYSYISAFSIVQEGGMNKPREQEKCTNN